MEETLSSALAALFKETAPAYQLPEAQARAPLVGQAIDRAQEALNYYDQAMERLKTGDWSGFGENLTALRRVLEELSQPSGSR